MTGLVEILLALPALALLVLAGFFALEVAGAFLPPRRAPSGRAGPLAVVIPAHNEAGGIVATIRNAQAQLREGDRLIVVADNCDDETAEIALRAGAACLIRNEPDRRGKGYALQFALDKLRDDPPDLVVFLDADCRLADGALAALAGAAAEAGRPAQALYLMRAPAGASEAVRVAAFAWLLMNRVRMGGLSTLFDVTRMTGAGMAVPWRIAETLDLASGEIVEDLALTTRLAEEGAPPAFCLDAIVESDFPLAEEHTTSQRARWENGSLRMAIARAPSLLAKALGAGDLRLAAVALDLAIPPLMLFAAALVAMVVIGLAGLIIGADLPLRLALTALTLFAAASLAGWLGFGLKALPPEALPGLAGHALQKLKVYGAEGRRSAARWTRTRRDGEEDRP